MRTVMLLTVLMTVAAASAQNVIYAYAIGDWRNGPVVTISPLFETTEQFTDPQLIARAKKDYAEFAKITDIVVERFATVEEGELSRMTLKGKYEARQLPVNLMDGTWPTSPVDDAPPAAPPAPSQGTVPR